MDYYSKGAAAAVFIAMFLIIGTASAAIFAWLGWWLAIPVYGAIGLVAGLNAKVQTKPKASAASTTDDAESLGETNDLAKLSFNNPALDGDTLNELSIAESTKYTLDTIIPGLSILEAEQIERYTEAYAAPPHLVAMMVLYSAARAQGVPSEELNNLIQVVEKGVGLDITGEGDMDPNRTLH